MRNDYKEPNHPLLKAHKQQSEEIGKELADDLIKKLERKKRFDPRIPGAYVMLEDIRQLLKGEDQ